MVERCGFKLGDCMKVVKACAEELRGGIEGGEGRGGLYFFLNFLKQVHFRYDVFEVHDFSKLSRRLIC